MSGRHPASIRGLNCTSRRESACVLALTRFSGYTNNLRRPRKPRPTRHHRLRYPNRKCRYSLHHGAPYTYAVILRTFTGGASASGRNARKNRHQASKSAGAAFTRACAILHIETCDSTICIARQRCGSSKLFYRLRGLRLSLAYDVGADERLYSFKARRPREDEASPPVEP
jgi:hypothetical protein